MTQPQDGDRDAPGARRNGEDAALNARLRELEGSLAARRPNRDDGPGGRPTSTLRGQGVALRLATEFIAGILIGGALGWGFDSLFGTSPWGLIVFLLFGFAAGVLNALRTAGLVAQAPSQRPDKDRTGGGANE